ncbi:hypothetical protein RHGRI_023129 [Rhododendron griersonianum]|uniref:U3 small nucleolar ribonucleoprotein protein IMP3 n=1 Tax=Rhododendron griersonianum TaxID=479676 RepID=A0AAV6J2M0_9ERIC|nr:hypothetical protein RHGRI_023129 [Rhododendron griersonianum]
MSRKLKFHEKKLLKKVDFLEWKREGGHREAQVLQRYHVTERDDYKKYNSLCRNVQKLVNILKQRDPRDPYRVEMTDALLEKLLDQHPAKRVQSLETTGIILVSYHLEKAWPYVNAYQFRPSAGKRRLSTVLVRLKYAEHLKEAVTYIQQGHIRVGPETVTDPAFLVTRSMEDFITWVDSSKIKRKVLEYNDKLDDYDAMN